MEPDMENWKSDILLVDDDPGNLLALEAVLEPLGQNLLRAQSGEAALRTVLRQDLAVIILDVRMPGMDGFETARMIRLRDRSRLTPVIFLTGVSTEMESAFRGYEAGAVDYLIKPVVPAVLRSKVSVFVDLHRKNAALTGEIRNRQAAEAGLRESEVQLTALAARLVSVREEERTRIAREIHDELGQMLASLRTDVTWIEGQLAGTDRQFVEQAAAMGRLIDSTMHLTRRISTGLMPAFLDGTELVAAIGRQAGELCRRIGARCRLDLPQAAFFLDKEISTTAFRIFQEILTNIARHANAGTIEVYLGIADGLLTLRVGDDGVGIPESRILDRESLGLVGMRERARHFGGGVEIRGSPGSGTMVSVSIPLGGSGKQTRLLQ